MSFASQVLPACVEWCVAGRPILGEQCSGDMHVVVPQAGGALVGVVDGLGHGVEAAFAARAAVEVLEKNADLPLAELMRCCHEGLRKTRGAALSIASFHTKSDTLSWVGVGNVSGTVFRVGGREALLLRGGVVGYRLPPLHVRTIAVHPGDTLVFVTDGIRGEYDKTPVWDDSPAFIAEKMLFDHAKATDDALVLVVRYRGASP